MEEDLVPCAKRKKNRVTVDTLQNDPASISLKRYVVIGGGIAGVCCAQELARLKVGVVTIISDSDTLVEVTNIIKS